MNSNRLINVFLIIAGLIGLLVGVGLAFFPTAMEAQYGIEISGNINHLSETRAPGVAILAISVIILLGAFKPSWKFLALVLSAIVFLSYGVGRLLSLMLDGVPMEGLLMAMIIELSIGIIALIALKKLKWA